MKNKLNNLLACSALLALSTNSFAQTEKGKSVIGLNAQIYSNKVYVNNSENGSIIRNSSQFIDLNYGKFVKKNLLVGLGASFSGNQSETGIPIYNVSIKSSGIGFYPGIRQYFGRNENFLFFAGAYYRLNFGKTESNHSDVPDSRYITSSFNAEAGMNYFLSKNFAFEAKFHNTTDLTGINDNNTVLAFGIRYWPKNTAFKSLEISDTTFKNWITGADINTSNVKTDLSTNNKDLKSTFQIYAGKFTGSKKNHLVGLAVGRKNSKVIHETSTEASHQTIITPFYEYYFKTTKLTPVARLSSSFSIFSNAKSLLFMENSAELGLAYFLNDHFLVRANFVRLSTFFQRYGHGSLKNNQFDFSVFDNTTLGLAYRW